jgi:spermidine synthase
MEFTEVSESDAVTTYRLTGRVWEGRTHCGTDVLVADSAAYGRMLFLDGELQSASADEHVYHEALVHPVLAGMRGRTDLRVLIVGGGEGATVREVLRWSGVAAVDWVDIDEDLVRTCWELLEWAPLVYKDSRVRFFGEDVRAFWGRETGKYDVVILDLPDPDGDTGYLYSPEFWGDVRGRLTECGAIVTHCGPVRPFGGIGAGYARVRAALGGDAAFYRVGIPSFQGDWGFMMWRADDRDPWHSWRVGWRSLPVGLRAVDDRQMREWAEPVLVWRTAEAAARSD